MKLNINSKELVALHNLLHEKFCSPSQFKYDEADPREADDVQLRMVYNRLRACIIAALTNKHIDPVDAFLSKEQAKIDKLKDENEAVKREGQNLADAVKNDPDFFVPDEGEDYSVPEYPRRGPRNRGGNRGGNKR